MPAARPGHSRIPRAITAFSGVVIAAASAVAVVLLPGSPVAAESSSNPSPAYTFNDEFNGAAGSSTNSTLWQNQTGYGWGGGVEKQAYTPGAHNAALTGKGSLMIDARGEDYTDKWVTGGKTAQYTSARLISKPSVLYGNVAARIKMTGSQGAHPAFWTLGANYSTVGWPFCGEIDVMEATNQLQNVYGSFHGPFAGQTSRSTMYNAGKMIKAPVSLAGGWHTYAAMWTPTEVTFSLDDVPYVTINRAKLPANQVWSIDSPQNIILNIAVGSQISGAPSVPSDFHATMEVDWVRVTPLATQASAPTTRSKTSTPRVSATPVTPRPAVAARAPKQKASAGKTTPVRLVAAPRKLSRSSSTLPLTITTNHRARIRVVSASSTTIMDRVVSAGRQTVALSLAASLRARDAITLRVYSVDGRHQHLVGRIKVRVK